MVTGGTGIRYEVAREYGLHMGLTWRSAPMARRSTSSSAVPGPGRDGLLRPGQTGWPFLRFKLPSILDRQAGWSAEVAPRTSHGPARHRLRFLVGPMVRGGTRVPTAPPSADRGGSGGDPVKLLHGDILATIARSPELRL